MLNLRQIDFRLCCCEVALEQDLNLVPILARTKLGEASDLAIFNGSRSPTPQGRWGRGYAQSREHKEWSPHFFIIILPLNHFAEI